ncbi:armadillo-type protein [Spinellus fusiger]|nr:armadillo-type protein [Spinellus fusiger]
MDYTKTFSNQPNYGFDTIGNTSSGSPPTFTNNDTMPVGPLDSTPQPLSGSEPSVAGLGLRSLSPGVQEGHPASDTVEDAIEEQELYPIAVLVDELKNEDVQLRLNAIRNLGTIAMALGPHRTRDELIPFLNDSIDDEDEVLLAVADELAKFTDYIGGPEYAHHILGPLENLSAVEEVLVRDKAVESLSKIVGFLNPSQIEHYFMPLLKRLSTGEWFTSRISATGLYAAGYPKCNAEQQTELKNMFAQLAQDDTPMVRRAAAKALKDFTQQLPKDVLIHHIMPLFLKLSNDDQDTVRLLTVEDLIQMTRLFSQEENRQYLLPSLKSLGQDKSWRVRFMVATHFTEICNVLGDTITREEMVALFVSLIKDSEGEVKMMTIGQAPAFAKKIDESIVISKILPYVKELVVDTNQHVRAAIATNISGFAPILGKDSTIEYLLPLFLQLLKDEFPDVRLNIISQLEHVNQVIGVDRLSQSLLPAIVELAEDKQWRVRLAIIEYIPLLAKQLGVVFFDDKLLRLCMSWLCDAVFSIREAATTNLRQLVDTFGGAWATETVIPQIVEMAHHTNFLFRMTSLFALATMAGSLSSDVVKDKILQTVLHLKKDPIPNIRFNVAKSLETLVPILKQTPESAELISTLVTPALHELSKDSDIDVRWFAEKALLTAQG